MENENNTNESGISLKQLWLIAKNKALVIILVTLLFTVAGAVYGLCFKDTTYKASSSAIVMAKDNIQSASEYQYSTALINTFTDFIVSDAVVRDAYEGLKANNPEVAAKVDEKTIKKSTKVTTSTNSLILTITVSSNEQDVAIAVANQLVKSTKVIANSLKDSDELVGGEDNVENFKYSVLANKFVEMNEASKQSTTSSRGAGTVIIISFLVGLVLSYGYCLIRFLCDDTYRSKSDFENATGVQIIAMIKDTNISSKNNK